MSLHSTTDTLKNFFKWVGIVIGGIILLFVLFNTVKIIVNAIFPPKLPPPTVSFGKLPDVSFPPPTSSTSYTYIINTVSGSLPSSGDRATVYKILQPEITLLNLQNTKDLVSKTEFGAIPPVAISEIVYQWTNPTLPRKVLTYNILSQNFDIVSQYLSFPDIYGGSFTSDTIAVDTSKSFLQSFNAYPDDIDETKTKTTLLSLQNGKFVAASSLSTTQLIHVDFFQKDINKLSIYYPHPPATLINTVVTNAVTANAQPGQNSAGLQVVETHYIHNQIDPNTNATYPIKSVQEAFVDLQRSRNTYIAQYYGTAQNIPIRDVGLGYYGADTQTQYLMPIYVFQGDNGFLAYVSAIKDAWIQK